MSDDHDHDHAGAPDSGPIGPSEDLLAAFAAKKRYRLAQRLDLVPGAGYLLVSRSPGGVLLLAAGIALWALVGTTLAGVVAWETPLGALSMLFAGLIVAAVLTRRFYYRRLAPRHAIGMVELSIATAHLVVHRCLRCERDPRGASGWCDACFTALQGSPLPDDHVALKFYAAATTGRWRVARGYLGPKVIARTDPGGPKRMPAKYYANVNRAHARAFPGSTEVLELAFQDPADQHLAWFRTTSVGRAPAAGVAYNTTNITRVRTAGHVVVEFRTSTPLLGSQTEGAPNGTPVLVSTGQSPVATNVPA